MEPGMDSVGINFNPTGSVMSRRELEDQRKRRGECVRCGRKCFHKKLFKMVPITDHGKVLNGRCLNCHPLDPLSDMDGGAIPAVVRRATREDVARFNRSQSLLVRPGSGNRVSGGNNAVVNTAGRSTSVPNALASTTPVVRSRKGRSKSRGRSRQVAPPPPPPPPAPLPASATQSSGSIDRGSTGGGSVRDSMMLSQGSTRSSESMSVASLPCLTGGGGSGSGVVSREFTVDGPSRDFSTDNSISTEFSSSRCQDPGVSVPHAAPPPPPPPPPPQQQQQSPGPRTPMSASPKRIPRASDHSSSYHEEIHQHHSFDATPERVAYEADGDSMYDHIRRSASVDMCDYVGASPQQQQHQDQTPNGVEGNSMRRALHQIDGEEEEAAAAAAAAYAASGPPHDYQARTNSRNFPTSYRGSSARSLHSVDSEASHHQLHHGVLDRGGMVSFASPGSVASVTQSSSGSVQQQQQQQHQHQRHSNSRFHNVHSGSARSLDSMSSFGGEPCTKNPASNSVNMGTPTANGESVNVTRIPSARARSSSPVPKSPVTPDHHHHQGGGSVAVDSHHNRFDAPRLEEDGHHHHHLESPRHHPMEHNRHFDDSYHPGDRLDQHHHHQQQQQQQQQQRFHYDDMDLGSQNHQHHPGGGDHNAFKRSFSMGADVKYHSSRSLQNADAAILEVEEDDPHHHRHHHHHHRPAVEGGPGAGPGAGEVDAAIDGIRSAGSDYLAILSAMGEYADVPAAQSAGMQELSNLHLSPDDSDALANAGGIQAIVGAMRSFPEDAELQIHGCRAMWNASGTAGNQIGFVEEGALGIVLHDMDSFLDDAEVQEQAMATLANLGAVEDNLVPMIDKGTVSRVVEAMNKHSENSQVQMKGCSVVTNLASHLTPLKKTIAEMGGGGAVVISMVMHPGDEELQEKALRALRNLSANCDENKIELANIGGIDAVISAMQVHRDASGVQEAGAWTLSNLAGNADNKVLIGGCGGIDVIIRAMWVHSDDVSVLEWCCRALYTLSLDPHNSAMVLDVGGISAIVNAMQAHVDSSAIQEMGCAVLCNLASGDDEKCKMRIVDEEALDAIVFAMVLFGDDAKVQERACQVLLRLAILENFKSMHASNVGELVKTAAAKFPEACQDTADTLLRVLEEFVSQYS